MKHTVRLQCGWSSQECGVDEKAASPRIKEDRKYMMAKTLVLAEKPSVSSTVNEAVKRRFKAKQHHEDV